MVAVEAGRLLLESQPPEAFDECLWCTQAAAPAWLRHTGLNLGMPAPVPVPGSANSSACMGCEAFNIPSKGLGVLQA